jgi:enoyl-CoA hydratase/carnithine racemase
MRFTNLDLTQPGDGVAVIRLAGPVDRKNLLDSSFLQELHGAAAHLRELDGVKVLVFIGTGRTFSTGADIEEIRDFHDQGVRSFLQTGQALVRRIMELDCITVAAVNGLALGGGLELALACDLRWAHRRAVFALPEAKLGLMPGWGGVPLLGRLVPASFSSEMIAGGDFVSARKGYEMGLVSRLFEEGDFGSAVLDGARKMAGMGEKELRAIKGEVRKRREGVDLSVCDGAFMSLWSERKKGVTARASE